MSYQALVLPERVKQGFARNFMSEITTIMGHKPEKEPTSSQIFAALIAIGLAGTFGLGALAIYQEFPGRIDFKLKDWVELGYQGRA